MRSEVVTGRTREIVFLSALAAVIVLAPLAAVQDAWAESPGNGLIIAVSGDAVVHRDGQEIPAEVGKQLRQGDTILVRQGGRCTGYTPGGQRFELAGPGELVLEKAEQASTLGDVTSWIRDQFARWIGESRRQPLIMRAVRGWDFDVPVPLQLVPGRDGRVRPRSAQLRWTTIPGIDRYTVTIAPEAGDEQVRTVRTGSLHLEDLKPGDLYVWKVVPAVAGWSSDGVWRAFTVMTAQEEAELELALRNLSDLEAAVILLSVGLHEEALLHLDAAVAGDVDTQSARLWRAHVLAELGLHRQAYEDLLRVRSLE